MNGGDADVRSARGLPIAYWQAPRFTPAACLLSVRF